jgi:hypothetical protein
MTFVLVTITAVLFYGLVRFRVPAEVGLVVLAAAGIDELWSRWGRGPATRPSPDAEVSADDDAELVPS